MIELKNVNLNYTKNYFILYNINVIINKGEKIVLFGEDGSGKTSFLRVILGLEKRFTGEASINNISTKKISFKSNINALYISSRGAFLEGKSVYKNIEYVLKLRGKNKLDSKMFIYSALKAYGLFSYKDVKVKNLSKFNRIMLALARASFRENLELICIDDIFKDLNESEKNHVIKHISKLIENKNVTSIIAVSDENIKNLLGTRIINLNLGSIVTND